MDWKQKHGNAGPSTIMNQGARPNNRISKDRMGFPGLEEGEMKAVEMGIKWKKYDYKEKDWTGRKHTKRIWKRK